MRKPGEPLLVGVAGISGSGKTFLTETLREHFKDELSVIGFDNYYKDHELQQRDDNGFINFDLPDALDSEMFAVHLLNLIEGHPVIHKKYMFETEGLPEETQVIYPAQVIVVEGLYVFEYAAVDKLLDLRVFIETDPELSLQRRLLRDEQSRGIDRGKSMYQWINHVLPSYNQHILPHREKCDLVLDGKEDVFANMQLLVKLIETATNRFSGGGQ